MKSITIVSNVTEKKKVSQRRKYLHVYRFTMFSANP